MPEFTPEYMIERTNDHINKYISLADNKASILLTSQLAFLGLSANAVDKLTITSSIVWWSFLLAGVLGIFSIFLSGWVVYPRTENTERDLMFWESIVKYDSPDDFLEEINTINESKVRENMVVQNFTLASVAYDKYKYLRWSLRTTAGMLILATIGVGVFVFG